MSRRRSPGRKRGDDEYIPSNNEDSEESEDSDSPTENISRPLRGRSKKKNSDTLSQNSRHSNSQNRRHSNSRNSSNKSIGSAGRNSSNKSIGSTGKNSPHNYSSTSLHSSVSSQGNRRYKKVGPKSMRRKKTRRQNVYVNKTSTENDMNNDNKKMAVPKIVIRNPTHKVVKMPKKNIVDTGKLVPPPPMRKKTKKKKDAEIVVTPEDKLLASLPLPSASIPHVFNRNISMIGSINIQSFGNKKSSNNVIMRIIADILRRYDIVLCQEIHAPEGKEEIIKKLVDLVSTPSNPYSYVVSHPIGRNSYQERYLFLYKQKEWKVLDDYVIDDDVKMGDKFIREPYVVRFQHLRKPDVRITLVGCHTQPEKAFEEIKVLVDDVYSNVKKKIQRDTIQEKRQRNQDREISKKKQGGILNFLKHYLCCCFGSYSPVSTRDLIEEEEVGLKMNEPIIMMGDFNAAGSYVNKKQREELDTLLKKNNLMWGIKHSTDTTVAEGTKAAYDRFVFETTNERRWIGNTRVWRFDEGWENNENIENIENIDKDGDKNFIKKVAKRVTDHYPIEFELKLQ